MNAVMSANSKLPCIHSFDNTERKRKAQSCSSLDYCELYGAGIYCREEKTSFEITHYDHSDYHRIYLTFFKIILGF